MTLNENISETPSNKNVKILQDIFTDLGLDSQITGKGNLVGKGADKKTDYFIRKLQKFYNMGVDGAISEKSATIICKASNVEKIKKFYNDISMSNINITLTKNKISRDTLKHFMGTSMLSKKINDSKIEISTEVKGGLLVGTDYESKQFINYLQFKYDLGIVDSMISNKYIDKLFTGIKNETFSEINEDRIMYEKNEINKLKTQIENLDNEESIYKFIGPYKKDENDNWSIKSKQNNQKYIEGKLVEIDKKYLIASKYGNDKTLKHKLRKEVIKPFNDMMEAYGKKIVLNYGYRSIEEQNNIYHRKDGTINPNATEPGTSEHQLGLAIDMPQENVGLRKWLKLHAHEYGFTQSYRNKNTDGGFQEKWHYRYVGKDLAIYLKNHNMSFTQFYIRNSKKVNKD